MDYASHTLSNGFESSSPFILPPAVFYLTMSSFFLQVNPSIPIFLALAESESETVAKYESQLESQLESNREFHSRQINRLRGEIDQKQKQIDNLREKNTEISSETDRLKVSYLDVKTIKLTKNYSVRIFCSSNKRPRKRRKIDHFDKEGRKK